MTYLSYFTFQHTYRITTFVLNYKKIFYFLPFFYKIYLKWNVGRDIQEFAARWVGILEI